MARVAVLIPQAAPRPVWITLALDRIGAAGPQVDVDLGGVEPMVDQWEAGELVPTPEQVRRLAAYTGMPVDFFYRPVPEAMRARRRTWMCERGRRGDNGLTVLESWVDWDDVYHVEVLTPQRPPRRTRPARPVPPAPVPDPAPPPAGRLVWRGNPAGVHRPVDDPDTPGCCSLCGLPWGRRNARHRGDVLPAAASGDPTAG